MNKNGLYNALTNKDASSTKKDMSDDEQEVNLSSSPSEGELPRQQGPYQQLGLEKTNPLPQGFANRFIAANMGGLTGGIVHAGVSLLGGMTYAAGELTGLHILQTGLGTVGGWLGVLNGAVAAWWLCNFAGQCTSNFLGGVKKLTEKEGAALKNAGEDARAKANKFTHSVAHVTEEAAQKLKKGVDRMETYFSEQKIIEDVTLIPNLVVQGSKKRPSVSVEALVGEGGQSEDEAQESKSNKRRKSK